MGTVGVIFRRELVSYFTMPLAYVFIVIFLVLAGALTYYMGGFFERGQADLQTFFNFHAFLYLFLIPALSMRLWAEERKTGTIELFLTLPITTVQAVLGKYFAAWAFTGIALALTFPVWITVNYLGHPDNGVILASYFGSFLMAGAFLAIGAAISAACKNQVIAFVLSATICFLFTAAGSSVVLGADPERALAARLRWSAASPIDQLSCSISSRSRAACWISGTSSISSRSSCCSCLRTR